MILIRICPNHHIPFALHSLVTDNCQLLFSHQAAVLYIAAPVVQIISLFEANFRRLFTEKEHAKTWYSSYIDPFLYLWS